MSATVLVVMGVSGAGKSTLGRALAERLGWTFQEGDDLHPPRNVEKMAAGIPLDDADRAPWLERIRSWIDAQLAEGRSGVVACSALKRRYRETLGVDGEKVVLVYLEAAEALLEDRLGRRQGHFMPPALLSSQLVALEPPGVDERPIVVQAADTPDRQVDAAVQAMNGA